MTKPYGTITKTILISLAMGGAIILAATSPRVATLLFKYLLKKTNRKVMKQKEFALAFSRLKISRLIIIKEKGDGTFVVELTEKGKRKIQEIQFEELHIQKPKKWDGIWRIVIFDIPKTKNNARDALRQKLKHLQFYQLQESTWVHPYPCNQEIEFLVELFGVYPYVQLIEASKIQNDLKLREYFNF